MNFIGIYFGTVTLAFALGKNDRRNPFLYMKIKGKKEENVTSRENIHILLFFFWTNINHV